MKTLIALFTLLCLLGGAFPSHAAETVPVGWEYHITADGAFPSVNGQALLNKNITTCSISTRYAAGSANLNVKLKNKNGTFITLSGGPITTDDFRFFQAPFGYILVTADTCTGPCDIYATVLCGIN